MYTVAGHFTHFQVGGDDPKVEGGILQNKAYFTFTLTFSFLKTK